MNSGEQIFFALNEIGTDLVDMAEHQRLSAGLWRKLSEAAACLLLLVSLGAAAWHLFPISTAPVSTDPPAAPQVDVSAKPHTEAPSADPTPAFSPPASLTGLPFYIFDSQPDDNSSPASVIDPDGNVILSVDSGKIMPLVDQLTGDYVGILVDRSQEAQDALDLYTLDGEQIYSGMNAYCIEVLGNLMIVSSRVGGSFQATLYHRSPTVYLRGDLQHAEVLGNSVLAVPLTRQSEEHWVFDADANLTIFDSPSLAGYYVRNNQAFYLVRDDSGKTGVATSDGTMLIPCCYTDIYTGYNPYLRCLREDGGVDVIDEGTGELVFQWDSSILMAYDNLALVHTEDGVCLVDRSGSQLAQGESIHVIDDNQDGAAEGFILTDGSQITILRDDASPYRQLSWNGSWEIISEQTLAMFDAQSNLSLYHPQTDTWFRDFSTAYTSIVPVQVENCATGLFYASYDGGIDLLREDGTVVLEHIHSLNQHQGDVFFCVEDGVQGLRRLDGSWLYREEL